MDTGITDIEAENIAALTGQAGNAVVRALRREVRRLLRELIEARDQANRYVLEAATCRLKLVQSERQATAGVTLARYAETIPWCDGRCDRAWLDGLGERIDAVLGRGGTET